MKMLNMLYVFVVVGGKKNKTEKFERGVEEREEIMMVDDDG